MSTTKNKLIGTWRLVSSKKILSDGSIIDVFGNNPMGYIIFTQESIMSVQIMRRERKNFHGDHLLEDYLAYTGYYSLNEHNKIMTVQIETSLSAHYLAKKIKREYHFENNRLILKVPESNMDYKITWERVC